MKSPRDAHQDHLHFLLDTDNGIYNFLQIFPQYCSCESYIYTCHNFPTDTKQKKPRNISAATFGILVGSAIFPSAKKRDHRTSRILKLARHTAPSSIKLWFACHAMHVVLSLLCSDGHLFLLPAPRQSRAARTTFINTRARESMRTLALSIEAVKLV